MDLDPNGVSFDNDHLSVGSRVQVVKGDFCGVEGELASEANKTYVVIRIAGVLSASVKVPKKLFTCHLSYEYTSLLKLNNYRVSRTSYSI